MDDGRFKQKGSKAEPDMSSFLFYLSSSLSKPRPWHTMQLSNFGCVMLVEAELACSRAEQRAAEILLIYVA